MVSTQPVPMLVEYLHNLLPCILAIYFLAALTLSACIAQKVRDVTRREQLQRRSIFLLMLAVASTYVSLLRCRVKVYLLTCEQGHRGWTHYPPNIH